ncbi:MAG TPA: YciI family protein [Gemmatimonadaceae bacterium]|nr:YciI family protein [Gemmatimonadaceae bacterium]
MKFILLVYNDPALFDALPASEFDSRMRGCFAHADELRDEGRLLESQQLGGPATARTVRVRNGRTTTTDGPFAEAKEVLGGFNIIEAESMEEAVRIAESFPWTRTGSIEVRPVLDLDDVRRRVGAAAASAANG